MLLRDYKFGWSNSYRVCLMIALIIPLADVFVQLALRNWAWMAVGAIVTLAILTMIITSYRSPFITLSGGVLRFYLLPILPIAYQSIRLCDVTSFSVKKSSIKINLMNGRKATANIYAVRRSDREKLLELLNDIAGNL